jgi:hypothetical protein
MFSSLNIRPSSILLGDLPAASRDTKKIVFPLQVPLLNPRASTAGAPHRWINEVEHVAIPTSCQAIFEFVFFLFLSRVGE